jgi:hypothetical protein
VGRRHRLRDLRGHGERLVERPRARRPPRLSARLRRWSSGRPGVETVYGIGVVDRHFPHRLAASLGSASGTVPLLLAERHAVLKDQARGRVSWVESECKPSSGSARHNLGVSLGRLGRKEESEDAFKKALEIAPGYPSAMRSHAAWALACYPGCDALRGLAAASRDPVPEVREVAVESLGRLVPDTDDPVSRITAACGSAPPDEP